MAYTCETCGDSFPKKSGLLQHKRAENHWMSHVCRECGKGFCQKKNLNRHMERHRDHNQHQCQYCSRVFSRVDSLSRHKDIVHDQSGAGTKRRTQVDTGPDPKRRLADTDEPRDFYTLTRTGETRFQKFKTKSTSYKVSFRDIEVDGLRDIFETLKRIFESLIDDVTVFAKPKDLIRMLVKCPELDFPIVLPFTRREVLSAETLLSEIERVLQSYEEFVLDQSLEIEVTHVRMPSGGKGSSRKYINLEKFLEEKRCIVRIRNWDDLCCARALVTAKARLDEDREWNSIRQGCRIQETLAKQLHEKARVPFGKCGIQEIKKFQDVLTDCQINVVSKDHMNAIIYSGPDNDKKVYLYHHDGHYDVITSMPAFMDRCYYCNTCKKGYDHMEKHKCNNACHCCRKIHESDGEWVHCNDCLRYFRGRECYDLHKKSTSKGKSTCTTLYKCNQCGQTINREMSKKHFCGGAYCQTCKDYFPEGHLCHMLPVQNADDEEETGKQTVDVDETDKDSDETKPKTFIFFDFECTQDSQVGCGSYRPDEQNGKCSNCMKAACGSMEHTPNLCVVHKVCESCLNENVTTDSKCRYCGPNELLFSGANTADDFCEWLFSGDNQKAIVLCHNFQAYDSYPVMRYLYKNAIKPEIILNGAKIMSLFVPHCEIKMIDSLNFLPTALSKLPAMFKIDELCKGYFPHLYNRSENQQVVLSHLPGIQYYNHDGMKPKEREAFVHWYDSNKNNSFDFQAELLKYCRSDVDILRRCCLKFRDLFMDVTSSDGAPGIDPFEHCCTIASACNLVFRTKFLRPDTIGIIKHHGYRPKQNQSVKAFQWLKYISRQLGVRIQHARNGGEKSVGPYLVDGYYETGSGEKVVLEFHGDFWHGNPTKYSRDTINPVNQMSMGDLYDRTIEKKMYLEENGFLYRSIWESDFDRQCLENDEMRAFIEDLDMPTPLEPRDSFYGGRTEAYTLYKEATTDETIDYYDVTSLYPWVNKTGKVPLGHPKIITEDFDRSIANYEGLVKCKILPPRGLYIPVLPVRINGKLLFPLCRTCAKNRQQPSCHHESEERALTGTWVTDEVKKALEKGYTLEKIYEVWHFENVASYDPTNKTGGVFTDYINTFLKIKQEASGWPSWCVTEQDKQKYIDQYYEKEGIRLDYDCIVKNPGLRSLAKLMLNSFWGKFGQRDNMPQVKYVTDPAIYFDMLTSDDQEVLGVHFVSDEMVEVRWRNKEDFIENSGKTNVVIAAYTTAQARLKLYSHLEKLGTRALYADTDSVVFATKTGEDKLPLGDYLGDLTDEVPGEKIKTFVTGGPKNYAYRLEKENERGDTVTSTQCKVRGITLNFKNALAINFDTVKRLVTGSPEEKVTVRDDFKIGRDNTKKRLLTMRQDKDYKVVFDKRVIRDNHSTVPYGY